MADTKSKALLEVQGLRKYFPVSEGLLWTNREFVKSVDGVSFSINKGETFGLVGESGCGKSTLGKCLIRLYDLTEGTIKFNGVDITSLKNRQLKPYRKNFQMIFQDPYSSLNTRMSVNEIIGEPLSVHKIASGAERQKIVHKLLNMVGLSKEHGLRYPHEFSGGQRQRIGIARALAVEPEFIICDEPVSALDVSIQAQVVNMLEDLQKELNLTFLFISHDLAMVQRVSDRIGVMYLGQIVEIAKSMQLFKNPQHPYTRALLSAIPKPDFEGGGIDGREVLQGEVPSPINLPAGCGFASRCKYVQAKCHQLRPTLTENNSGHLVACHFAGALKIV